MKKLIQKVEIRKSKIHGWGVFAKQNIKKGETIEQCPYLVTFIKNHKKMNDYLFYRSRKTGMIILGYGSLYNHTRKNNADYYDDTENKLIEFVAKREIKKGKEISINYGKKYFNERGMKIK